MQASAITNMVSSVLADAGVDWTEADLLSYMNDAIRAITIVRPDAYVVTESWQLSTGTRQALPAGRTRLHRINCNMGSDGQTRGPAMHRADYKMLDRIDPTWRADASATAALEEWLYDDQNPLVFDVSPGVQDGSSVWVEAEAYATPAELAALSDPFLLSDKYAPPVAEWIFYRAYSRDEPGTANYRKAQDHYASFYNLLDVKMKSDARSFVSREASA